MHTYIIEAFLSQQTVNDGCDYDCDRDTLAEAKKAARHAVSQEFADGCEMSSRFGYARVMRDGECVYDCFAK